MPEQTKDQASTDNPTPSSGPVLVDKVAQHPTLDLLLDRDPAIHPYDDAELDRIIKLERMERASFNIREDKRRAKKQGIEEVKPEESSDADE